MDSNPQERRRKFSPAVTPDKEPPSAPEAEIGVLGCIMIDPQVALTEARVNIKSGDVFYCLKNQAVWNAVCDMQDAGEAIDVITLQNKLKDRKQLDVVGGLAYLSSLPDEVPSAANLGYYLDIVFDKYVLRKMIQTATEIVAGAYANEGDVNEFVKGAEADFLKATTVAPKYQKTVREFVFETVAEIETAAERRGQPVGIQTGFSDLDRLLMGLHASEVTIIGARPSTGKSSICQNIIEHAAIHNNVPCAIFTFEMPGKMWTMRMIASQARINSRAMRSGTLMESAFAPMTVAAGKIAKAPIYIIPSSGKSVEEIRSLMRYYATIHGVKLFGIDYMQLMHSISQRAKQSREREIAVISGTIHEATLELNVSTILLSQLNRESEKDKKRKPRMADLREGGALENDAENIWLMHRVQVGEGEQDLSKPYPVEIVIPKQRNGPPGEVTLTFLPEYTRFENAIQASKLDESDFTWVKRGEQK